MCMATVDLPEPPFSFPTTMTWTGRTRVVVSIDMSALEFWLGNRNRGRFLVKRIDSDSRNSHKILQARFFRSRDARKRQWNSCAGPRIADRLRPDTPQNRPIRNLTATGGTFASKAGCALVWILHER